MRESMTEKQIHLRTRLDEREKLVTKKDIMLEQQREHQEKKRELEATLSKEQLDLHKMDSFSLVNIWRKWQGTHNTIRKEEAEEAAKAELKLNEHEKMCLELEEDLVNVSKQLKEYSNAESDWKSFLIQKENWLRDNNESVADEMDDYLNKYADLNVLIKEINEAIGAGNTALGLLRSAKGNLDSAKSWSTYDTFFGGGMISTMVKHSNLNESEDTIHKAQHQLRKFEAELADVKDRSYTALTVERGSFITFADYFFDDIFAEWTMHNRIKNSIQNVENVMRQVQGIVSNLEQKRSDIEVDRDFAYNSYRRLVVQS